MSRNELEVKNTSNSASTVGAVVIGRNEGQRLVVCLESLIKTTDLVVYVDSGSTDNSTEVAKKLGAKVISLDLSIPFTAARARNEGANYLLQQDPKITLLQFVDGDCEVHRSWVEEAEKFLNGNPSYAVVCGRRREKFPEKSVYNQLCDIEWDSPIGDALACGGDALIRVSAFKQVGGYNKTLIAGEEPEMCFRLRASGWKIYRLDAEMTLHDAAMMKFTQWWSRAKRSGYAYIEGYYLHGKSTEHYKQKQTISVILWAVLLPILLALLALWSSAFLLLATIYPFQVLRLTVKNRKAPYSFKSSFYYALSNVVGKFPQFLGMMRFVSDRYRGNRGTLIEYK